MSTDVLGRYSVKFLGNATADGHTTYTVRVMDGNGESWEIQKRYREIRDLHDELKLHHGDQLPPIPGKRLWGNQDPVFIAQRQVGLEQYLDGVLQLEPEPGPLLLQFLGCPAQHPERNKERQDQQVLDNMQSKILNLALPPAPLDDDDMALRLKKYGQAMKLHVLSQPVDPIHLRAPGFDGEPVQLAPSNGESFEALKIPKAAEDGGDAAILKQLLSSLQKVLKPEVPIADPGVLIVPFPEVTISQYPLAVQ